MHRSAVGGSIITKQFSRLALIGSLGLASACAGPATHTEAKKDCSTIVKIEQINRPLTWGERTLDEISAHTKFRSVYLLQTEKGKQTHSEPVELNIKDGFEYSVGDPYCTTTYIEVPLTPSK